MCEGYNNCHEITPTVNKCCADSCTRRYGATDDEGSGSGVRVSRDWGRVFASHVRCKQSDVRKRFFAVNNFWAFGC